MQLVKRLDLSRLLASRPHAEAEVDDHRVFRNRVFNDDPPAVIAGIRNRISLPIVAPQVHHDAGNGLSCAGGLPLSCSSHRPASAGRDPDRVNGPQLTTTNILVQVVQFTCEKVGICLHVKFNILRFRAGHVAMTTNFQSKWERQHINHTENPAVIRDAKNTNRNEGTYFEDEVETKAARQLKVHRSPTCLGLTREGQLHHRESWRRTWKIAAHISTALLTMRSQVRVQEKVFCLATNGSSRRIDIIAYSQTTKKGYIIDTTIRIETGSSQPEDVNQEKINIYLPTVDYFKAKYQLEDIEVIGLLIGARGVIPKCRGRSPRWMDGPVSSARMEDDRKKDQTEDQKRSDSARKTEEITVKLEIAWSINNEEVYQTEITSLESRGRDFVFTEKLQRTLLPAYAMEKPAGLDNVQQLDLENVLNILRNGKN
ncbi:hypothetical protein ANN_21643 [Periplaneta americana]|uniref:Uncharacterized protein n=1 Tax=Periplaneta americana TaxID=6978 RepID=A0ABQ8S610_PERAM|nr:hypothetical protein ANN_21643 [Periplaneta americana]